MLARYKDWTVRGYMRRVVDQNHLTGELEETGEREAVVVVFDPSGWEWEATATNGQLTSLTVRGGPISARSLAHIPLVYLQDVATTYLATVQLAFESHASIADALREADLDQGEVHHSKDAPTTEVFAQVWKVTPSSRITEGGTKTTPRRELLASRFGVSVYTIDAWTQRARSRGLIPPPTTGRGNRKKTDDKKPSAEKETP